MSRPNAWWFLAGAGLALAGFAAGRLSAPPALDATPPRAAALIQIQDGSDPTDPRELIPFPGTVPGQGPGQGVQPGDGQCPLYLYQDGELYRFDLPGTPGGIFPGGDGSPELIPIQPAPRIPLPPGPLEPRPPGFGPERLGQATPDLLASFAPRP